MIIYWFTMKLLNLFLFLDVFIHNLADCRYEIQQRLLVLEEIRNLVFKSLLCGVSRLPLFLFFSVLSKCCKALALYITGLPFTLSLAVIVCRTIIKSPSGQIKQFFNFKGRVLDI